MNQSLKKAADWFEQKSKELGLNFFDIQFEMVPEEVMLEASTYGLPTRYRHWSFGQSYEYQKINGEMGYSKLYEVIFNNDPSYAFLLDTNPEFANKMVIAHCFGHCLAGETEVSTLDGPKRIDEILVGDVVIDFEGKYRKVEAKVNTKNSKNLIEIKSLSCPMPIRCTPEHKLLVKNIYSNQIAWVEAKDIDKTIDRLVIPKTKSLINADFKKINIDIEVKKSTRLWKKELAKTGGYQIDVDYDFGRILGLYISEGYGNAKSSFGFAFHQKEAEYHEFVHDYFKNISINSSNVFSKTSLGASVIVYDSSWMKWLSENCGTGCQNKVIPDVFIRNGAPYEFWKGMIRGLFEGDGYLKGRDELGRDCCFYTTTSKVLAHQLLNLLRTFGNNPYTSNRQREGRKRAYEISLFGKSARKVLDICNVGVGSPNRNFITYEEDENYLYTEIDFVRNIELAEEIPVWDIQVEGGHSFLLEGGIVAHNSTFFFENVDFQETDRKMVYNASDRANRIDDYIKTYGIKRVEKIIDIGMSLERNIDLHRGQYRSTYKRKPAADKRRNYDEFDDLLGGPKLVPSAPESFPPYAEKDILWFLINYSNLEAWQKDVLSIIRDESFYFSAIISTKICNEGFASVVHAELMSLAPEEIVSHQEYIDFANLHSRVVQPGGDPTNLNPYYLGFSILQDIRARWDEKFKNGESDINGWQKILEVIRTEDDNSLIRNYVTQELVDKLELFVYRIVNAMDGSQYLEIASRNVNDVINYYIDKSYANKIPVIAITKAGAEGIELTHMSKDIGTLDIKHMKKVMGYLQEIWGGIVDLETVDENGDKIHFSYDEAGFSGDEDQDTEEF